MSHWVVIIAPRQTANIAESFLLFSRAKKEKKDAIIIMRIRRGIRTIVRGGMRKKMQPAIAQRKNGIKRCCNFMLFLL